MKTAFALVAAVVSFSALAQDSIYDRRSGSAYEIRPQATDPYRRDTYQPAPNPYIPPPPAKYDVYSPSGQQTGTGQFDSSGRLISDQTGRPVGRMRY